MKKILSVILVLSMILATTVFAEKAIGGADASGQFGQRLARTIGGLITMLDKLLTEEKPSVSGECFADKMNSLMPKDKNYMFSPMSVKMALALAANGADGDTKKEILDAVGISDLDEFNALSKDLIERYSKTDILSLSIANSVWINGSKTQQNFSTDYKELATAYFNADVKTVGESEAVGEINSWVSEKTNGKIKKIIEKADFAAMLVNAIYFKGAWLSEFSEHLTAPDEFTNADGNTSQIDFMNKTGWIMYAETKDAQMIELRYKNAVEKLSEEGDYLGYESFDDIDVSMYLIASEGDIDVEHQLNSVLDNDLFESKYIALSMPKFEIEFETGLNEMLRVLGMKTAFDEDLADFGKMFDMGNMWISGTLHKTYIKVDEKGTEAAAVTGIGMATSSLPPEPTVLKFNKPFHFVIRDNTSGEILFMGRYAYSE